MQLDTLFPRATQSYSGPKASHKIEELIAGWPTHRDGDGWGRDDPFCMRLIVRDAPRVKAFEPLSEYKLRISFTNDEVGIYDCSPLLDFGVFQQFRDEGYFQLARAEYGTVVWPNGQDICPDTLYEAATRSPAQSH